MGKAQLNARIRGTFPHCELAQEGLDRTTRCWQRSLLSDYGKRTDCQEDAIANLQLGIGVRTSGGLRVKNEGYEAAKLGDMAAKVQATAGKLSPGSERDNILQEISLQNMGPRPTRQAHKSEGK